jgi:hypothetical protein
MNYESYWIVINTHPRPDNYVPVIEVVKDHELPISDNYWSFTNYEKALSAAFEIAKKFSIKKVRVFKKNNQTSYPLKSKKL